MPTSFSPETRAAVCQTDLLWSANMGRVPLKCVPPQRCGPRNNPEKTDEVGLGPIFPTTASLKRCRGTTAFDWDRQSVLFIFHCISAVMTSCHQMPANSSFSLPSSVRPSCPAPPLDSYQLLFRQSHTSCQSSLSFCSINKFWNYVL